MSVNFEPPAFAFVIDTDQYAGNFEREMCAFITGLVGECGKGEDEANLAFKQLPKFAKDWFIDHVSSEPDDHGCNRPVTIWPTPGWFNDGQGSHWKDGHDPEEVRVKYEKSVRGYYEPLIKQAEKLLDETVPEGRITWADTIERYKKTIADSVVRSPGRWPAYQSVAIFLDKKPTGQIWEVIRKRAKAWRVDKDYRSQPTITGFRLIKFELKVTEFPISFDKGLKT